MRTADPVATEGSPDLGRPGPSAVDTFLHSLLGTAFAAAVAALALWPHVRTLIE